MPTKGISVILGTAGSGKTTLALYRAAFLVSEGLSHSGKTLLLTYNNALVNHLKFICPEEFQNVTIENYHKFARGYLDSRNKMEHNCILDKKQTPVNKAITKIINHYPKNLFPNKTEKFFEDEIAWIQSHGLSESGYCQFESTERMGTQLPKEQRPMMYKVFQEYLKERNELGKNYDWDDLASYVGKELEIDNSERMYKHIVVDEGQDFSPEMIRSLNTAIPTDGSLTFFGDVTQQIYGQRTSWRGAGLKIPEEKIWRFEENYRNTKQISALGLAISKMPYFDGIADIVMPTFQQNDGPLPVLVKYADPQKQIKECVVIAQETSQNKTVAILFPNHSLKRRISDCLDKNAIELKEDFYQIEDVGLFYGTYHSAKGLEFDQVVLPFLDSDNLPDREYVKAHGKDEALTHYARLLYVAITRAKSELVFLYSGTVTPLLPPPNNNLYQCQAR